MFHWTWNNHLSCGFHQDPSGRVNKDVFFSRVGSAKRKVGTAFEEAQIAAELIYKETKKSGRIFFYALAAELTARLCSAPLWLSVFPFKQ